MSRSHPLFARYYARASLLLEPSITAYRRELLTGLTGRVIEVGAGNGLNFAHYPATVTEVLAVEPEPHLRDLAHANAERATVPITVVDAVADTLPAPDSSHDAVISSLVLCTVQDQDTALAEMFRVLRPGGNLRFFEHVRARRPASRRIQKALDATVFPLLVGGCHCARDTTAAIERAGFTIDHLERLTTADTRMPFPTAPQILGIALRPGRSGPRAEQENRT